MVCRPSTALSSGVCLELHPGRSPPHDFSTPAAGGEALTLMRKLTLQFFLKLSLPRVSQEMQLPARCCRRSREMQKVPGYFCFITSWRTALRHLQELLVDPESMSRIFSSTRVTRMSFLIPFHPLILCDRLIFLLPCGSVRG